MWELDYKDSWALRNWCSWLMLWCWRRLLRVLWTTRRSKQSILREISPEYSLEGLMLKLKLHYSGHMVRRTDLLEKTLLLGKIEGRWRRDVGGWDSWMASLTMDMGLSKLWELVIDREDCPWGHKEMDMAEWLNWTEGVWSLLGLDFGLVV